MKEIKGKFHFDGHKLIYHMDRVYDHYVKGKKIYPLHIDIGVTKACNAKCVYCYGIKQQMTNDIMPSEILFDVFGTAPKLGIKSITVTGDGEPTLNSHIFHAMILGHSSGLDIGFATNGIALSMDRMRTLLERCIWVRFNLSAVDQAKYEMIHGVDAVKIVKKNIYLATDLKEILGSRTTIGLQMVLIPDCIDQVIPEAKFAIDAGVDYFVIKQFSDPGCDEMSRFDLSKYDSKEVLDVLREAESMSTDKTKIVPKWGMIKDKGKRRYERCVDCALLFQISGSGKCYPCGYLFGDDRYCYGDLHKQTLKQILDSDRYWEVVKYMRESFDVNKDCQGACRHDFTNKFMWDFLHCPEHINFI